jgi:hypothetical protein
MTVGLALGTLFVIIAVVVYAGALWWLDNQDSDKEN